MSRFSPWFGAFCALVLAGCDSFDEPVLEPGMQVPAILDSRDTEFAGSGVFLLPPISDNGYARTAPFDLNADPRVEICRLDVAGDLTIENIEAAPCVEVVAWFETDVSHDGVTFVTVTPGTGEPATADSSYSVNWNTDPEDAGSAFRGSILVPRMVMDGGTPVVQYENAAQFDALLYSNSSEKLDPNYVVGTTAGQNFPLKFIMEQSRGCNGLDCFAYRVSCEAGVYQTEHAGVLLPEDWATQCDTSVPGPERSWWLFQERLAPGSPCIPGGEIDGFQYEPCYVWQLAEEVDVGNATAFQLYNQEFANPATIQFCYNEEQYGGVPEPLIPLSAVYRFSQTPGGSEVALTPGAEENALTNYVCPYDGPQGVQATGPLAALSQLLRPALRLLGVEPQPLFAGDGGTLSTKTIRMSHFQHVVFLNLRSDETLGPLLVGQSEDITVQLTTPPHHDPLDGPEAGVPGVQIQYEVVSGDADLSGGVPCTDAGGATIDDCIIVVTSVDDTDTPEDEGGDATATLTIGSSGGTVVIRISVPGDPDVELELYVEAVELDVVFLEPLDTGDFSGAPDERFEPVVFICEQSAFPCDAGSAEAGIPTSAIKLVEENGGRKFYQADWKPRDTGTGVGGTYVAQVVVGDATVGYSIPIVTTKGGKGERIDDVYYNGINSSLALKFTITPGGS